MAEVSFVATCDAPVDVAFEYIDDYRNVTEYWHGMESYQPVGDLDHGLGAVFEAASKVGPSTLRSTVKAVEWEKSALLVYKSVAGMDSSTSFVFSAVDESHCTVEFRIGFTLPGGIVGRTMEKTLEPFINAVVKNTAENISSKVNAYYANRSDTSK